VHQAIGQMVIGAGIVNVLLDFVKISSRGHLQMVAANKAIVILDGFLYGYTNAFTAFIAANGLDAFIGRVKSEVDGAVEEHREEAEKLEVTVIENSTGLLSFQQGSVLKSILRAIHRLMTTSGTTEGLRNLIDTSLLSSVKKVMENRFIFGPQVFALVTNIAATFVHNEPTSLTTLQEAKVPDALYDSLERAIPASNDVLQAVPNAIGAFCLNQAGLDHFLTRDLIAKYFAIFTSPAHYELLRDRDSAVNLGSAIDELVRHHPTLKAKILDTIFSIFVEFKRMGAGYVPPASESGYNLKPTTSADATSTTTAAGSSEDVAMQEGAAQGTEEEQATKDKKKAEEEKTKDNEVTNAIDVFGRVRAFPRVFSLSRVWLISVSSFLRMQFLEGLFQNVGHTQDFIEHKGKAFDLLLDLLELPCSPAIMLKNGGYSSIVALFRISSEIKAAEALTAILGRTDKWLNETKWFWEPTQSDDGDRKSTLAAMVHPSADEFDTQQKRFRDLTILLSHVSLLSDVFTNLGYAHGKAATAILSVFTVKGPQAEILQRIGQVYRACLWENVTIRPTSFWSGEASKAATEQLAKDAPEGEAPTPAVAVARERQQAQAADVAAREVISTPATPDSPNIKLVQDVVQSFTRMTLPLYQTIVKLLVHRRSPDAAHRKVARAVAQQIASFMRDTLAWPNAHDLPANLAYSAQSLILVTKLHLDGESFLAFCGAISQGGRN
jgi:E3 ubiquitin-protein ligase HUWE1